jgi:heme/copper-type cytochrome/quinol oxidase subunit 2
MESNKQKVTGLLRKVHIEMRMEAVKQIQHKEEEIKKEKKGKMGLYICLTFIFVISLMVIVYLSFRMIAIALSDEEHKTRKMTIHITLLLGLSFIVFCLGFFGIIPFLFG